VALPSAVGVNGNAVVSEDASDELETLLLKCAQSVEERYPFVEPFAWLIERVFAENWSGAEMVVVSTEPFALVDNIDESTLTTARFVVVAESIDAPPKTPSFARGLTKVVVAEPPITTWLEVVAGRMPEPLKNVQFTSVPAPPPVWSVPQVNWPLFHSNLSADVLQVPRLAPKKLPVTVTLPCASKLPVVVAPPEMVRPLACVPPPIVDEAAAIMPLIVEVGARYPPFPKISHAWPKLEPPAVGHEVRQSAERQIVFAERTVVDAKVVVAYDAVSESKRAVVDACKPFWNQIAVEVAFAKVPKFVVGVNGNAPVIDEASDEEETLLLNVVQSLLER